MSLRTILLIIGAVIVVAVYGFTAYKRRRESRLHFDRRLTRLDVPDVLQRYASEDDAAHAPRLSARSESCDEIIAIRTLSPAEVPPVKPPPRKGLLGTARAAAAAISNPPRPAPMVDPEFASVQADDPPAGPIIHFPSEVVLPPQDQALAGLPAVRNDNVPPAEASNSRKRSDQLELFGGAPPTSTSETATSRRRATKGPAPAPAPESGLISLYVRAHEGKHFSGTTLVKALNSVGMQFGEMTIFHHFGAGDLKCQTPVFSAANMFEPGTFDLRKIEAFRTAGVALFLQLPGPLDGPVAFELLLNTAQRLTELTGGELYVDPKHLLDAPHIARLRKRAAHFAHARH